MPSGSKAFRLKLWSHSQICSVSSRARNSHFKRARHSFASPANQPSPSACLHHGPAMVSTGLEVQPTPHTSTPALHLHWHPLSHHPLPAKAGAREPAGAPSQGGLRGAAKPSDGSKPPEPVGWGCRQMPGTARGLQRRCSHQSTLQGGAAPAQSGRWGREAIWDQFADRKRLNLPNKRYQLSPATCSQTLNCSGEGSASLLSGYFHFSSFQPCLGARLLGGRQRTGVTQRTGPVTSAAPTLGDLGPWASSPPCLSPPQSGGNTFLLFLKKKNSPQLLRRTNHSRELQYPALQQLSSSHLLWERKKKKQPKPTLKKPERSNIYRKGFTKQTSTPCTHCGIFPQASGGGLWQE